MITFQSQEDFNVAVLKSLKDNISMNLFMYEKRGALKLSLSLMWQYHTIAEVNDYAQINNRE